MLLNKFQFIALRQVRQLRHTQRTLSRLLKVKLDTLRVGQSTMTVKTSKIMNVASTISLGIVVCLLLYLMLYYAVLSVRIQPLISRERLFEMSVIEFDKELLEFLPDKNAIKSCDDIFTGKESVSPLLKSYFYTMSNVIDFSTRIHGGLSTGHIGDKVPQVLTFLKLVNSTFVNTVCEVGFNAGHSALVWLVGNPTVKVYTFDVGQWKYTKPNAKLLQAAFPSRLKPIWGDSTKTIPLFIKENPKVKCDIIFIDGGHEYRVFSADIKNLHTIANPVSNLLLIDDFFSKGIHRSWQENLKMGLVKEHFSCAEVLKPQNKNYSFGVGNYINN